MLNSSTASQLIFGRTAHEFDFLGYHFTPQAAEGLKVAWRTVCNHIDKIARLYEQGVTVDPIGQYVKGWMKWVTVGVEFGIVIGLDVLNGIVF